MRENDISRATLGRVPEYLRFLRELPAGTETISAPIIARELGLGEVQVRKDLGALCGAGKPKIGYPVGELKASLEGFLRLGDGSTVIVGAGKLGRALLDYGGFSEYGIDMLAAFDINVEKPEFSPCGRKILPLSDLGAFCRAHKVRIGVIAVPAQAAQEVCNLLYDSGVKTMWCFAPRKLYQPADAVIRYENMALSLAHLKMQSREAVADTEEA